MTTIKQAIDFASDNGVTVSTDTQGYKGCVETVKHFFVYKSGKNIRIEQSFRGAKTWNHGGNEYYNRAAAIITAVTEITGIEYVE